MKFFSAAQASGAIIGILIALAVMGLGAWYVFVPAWKVFLQVEGFWGPAAALFVGGTLLGMINIPIGIRVRGIRYGVNLLGFGMPIVVACWMWGDITPPLTWHPMIPIVVSLLLYFPLTWTDEKGVRIPLLLLWGLSIADVLFFHYVAGYGVREVMWWGFTCQFSTLLIVDLYRGFFDAGPFSGGDGKLLSFGGAGASDALWSGPVGVVTLAFVFQWILWEGLDTILPP